MKTSCIEKVARLIAQKEATRAANLPATHAAVSSRRVGLAKGAVASRSRQSTIGKKGETGYASNPS